jgi:hypothetical protein
VRMIVVAQFPPVNCSGEPRCEAPVLDFQGGPSFPYLEEWEPLTCGCLAAPVAAIFALLLHAEGASLDCAFPQTLNPHPSPKARRMGHPPGDFAPERQDIPIVK